MRVQMWKLKITTVGRSAGIILNKKVMARLNVKKGDWLCLTGAPGGYRLTRYSADLERQMKLAEKIMHEDRALLRRLSK